MKFYMIGQLRELEEASNDATLARTCSESTLRLHPDIGISIHWDNSTLPHIVCGRISTLAGLFVLQGSYTNEAPSQNTPHEDSENIS